MRFRKSPFDSRGGFPKMPIRGNVGLRPRRGTFFRFSAVPDPDLKIRGVDGGGVAVSKEFFSALRATLWSKKKAGGASP